MKKLLTCILIPLCLLGLFGCARKFVPPDADMCAVYQECYPGTIEEIFTEGGGADLAEVIKLAVKDQGPVYFTITEQTEFLTLDSTTGEMQAITKEALSMGDRVEIQCESYQTSSYHPILTLTVIE